MKHFRGGNLIDCWNTKGFDFHPCMKPGVSAIFYHERSIQQNVEHFLGGNLDFLNTKGFDFHPWLKPVLAILSCQIDSAVD
jgi:hypothetical protein